MESVIRKLYGGGTFACEDPTPKTEQYRRDAQLYARHMEQFAQALRASSPELARQLEQLEEHLVSLHAAEEENRFVQGFHLGVRLMLETVL